VLFLVPRKRHARTISLTHLSVLTLPTSPPRKKSAFAVRILMYAAVLTRAGLYDITMEFTEDYPHTPPKCKFPAGFFHPNVYPSGTVCLSILNAEEAWKPGITLKQILLGIQDLLDTPNPQSPAQQNAYIAYTSDRATYDKRVKEQVAQNRPDRYE